MPIGYLQEVTQRYPRSVLINTAAQEDYFPDTEWSDFQIYHQINNEQLAIAIFPQNLQ